jgi:hypothetical protein
MNRISTAERLPSKSILQVQTVECERDERRAERAGRGENLKSPRGNLRRRSQMTVDDGVHQRCQR